MGLGDATSCLQHMALNRLLSRFAKPINCSSIRSPSFVAFFFSCYTTNPFFLLGLPARRWLPSDLRGNLVAINELAVFWPRKINSGI